MATEEEEGELKIEDSNMDGYGGEEHREKQRALADKQAEWNNVGEEVGLQVWRIEKFEVKDWPKEEYGTFFGGDSFIILHSYKEEDNEAFKYNVHFWLGENTSQDEAGAAAIKTVELDDKLGDLPVQYRQVQGHETKEFLEIFPTMNIKGGGVDSGFNHVEPTEYEHRLIHVYGRGKKVKSKEIELKIENLNNNDCFLLDAGTELFAFYPGECSVWEKRGTLEKRNKIEAGRSGKVKKKHIIEWSEGPAESPEEKAFWAHFGVEKPAALPQTSEYQAKKAAEEDAYANHVNTMYHITDEGGHMVCTEVGSGNLDFGVLAAEDDDILIVDVGRIIYVWVGSTSNREEATHAMAKAQQFLYESDRPKHTPMKRIFSGQEPADFHKCFGCDHVPKDICN